MLTIETWLRAMRPQVEIEECPGWPPDLFALTGTLIRGSGAYLRLFRQPDPTAYARQIHDAGAQWREDLDAVPDVGEAEQVTQELRNRRPTEIRHGWDALIAHKSLALNAIDAHPALAEQLIRLALIADEASRGIGIRADNETDAGARPSRFLSLADRLLFENDGRSFCWDIARESLCVLGKQHTPLKGATFRSLSHHLCLSDPGEIDVIWFTAIPKKNPSPRGLNLLLLPWPTEVETHDFQELAPARARADGTASPSYFRYRPQAPEDLPAFERKLRSALTQARQHAGPVDAIIFPELALSPQQYMVAEREAFQAQCILICGRRPEDTKEPWDGNECILQVAGAVHAAEPDGSATDEASLSRLRLKQAKHHRWYLDGPQIVTYQLGGALPAASRGAWENIDLPDRRLHFVTLNPITWAVLICEDLARQEPAGELIRAVGPNLLIALLMDGPQLNNRWPARYAAVLAEDPGSSVLTLTSLGMAKRSRPIVGSGQRAAVSPVIALWRDAFAGEIQIALDPGHDACVLTLEYRDRKQYSADGRSDQGQTPVYAGYRCFHSEPPVTGGPPPPPPQNGG